MLSKASPQVVEESSLAWLCVDPSSDATLLRNALVVQR